MTRPMKVVMDGIPTDDDYLSVDTAAKIFSDMTDLLSDASVRARLTFIIGLGYLILD